MRRTTAGFTRRELVRRLSAAGACAALGPLDPPLTAQTVGIRRNLGLLDRSDPDIQAFIAGVQAMRKLPSSDRRSWEAQAKGHADFCPHENWFFLPWHRAFLHSFEQICRAVSGKSDFMLPYWNWTADPQVPLMFFDTPVLVDPTRQRRQTETAEVEYVGSRALTTIMDTNDFETFGSGRPRGPGTMRQRNPGELGGLEGTPHNHIHEWIHGHMAHAASPLDPIFWLHHGNVDRLWAEWSRRFQNPSASDWQNFSFDRNFSDKAGLPINVAVRDVLDTQNLGYRYDTQPPGTTTPTPAAAGTVVATADGVPKGNARGSQPLSVDIAQTTDLRSNLSSVAKAPSGSGTVRITLDNVTRQRSGIGLRVFLNCDYAAPDTPTTDPHYVGSVAFFNGSHPPGDGEPMHVALNASAALRAIQRAQRLDLEKPLTIQLLNTSSNREANVSDVSTTVTRVRVTVIRPGG